MRTLVIAWLGAALAAGSPLPAVAPGPAISLEEALRMADERNLSLEASRIEIERSDAELYMAWAALLPAAKAGMPYSHLDHADTTSLGGSSITTRRQDALSGSVEVSVPLVAPQTWAGVSAARVGVDIARLSVDNARQALLLMVAQSYYQALTARSLVDVQEGQLRSAERHHEVARMRLVSGVGERLDVLRARADVARVRESLLAAHTALTNSRDALAILTGAEGLPMPVEVPEAAPPAGDDEELVEAAMSARQDIRLKGAMRELYRRQLSASWMQFLPSLNASWQLAHQFTETSDMGDPDPTRWTAFLTLSVPIYNQTRYADLDVKRAAVRKAELDAEDARQGAALEIRTARRNYATAVDRIAAAAEQAELAREALTLTEDQYNAGTGSSLAVTDARRSGTEAELNLATRRFEAQIALLKLLRAVGIDMSEAGEAGE